MHDRVAANGVAMRTVSVLFPNTFDVGCFSHTLDIVGEKFKTPHLVEFSAAWISMFAHSPKARLTWKQRTGRAVRSLSKTRWWSRWEVYNQLLELFGDVQPFLEENDEISPINRSKMLAILQDPQRRPYLMVELAIVVDAGKQFVQATYNLEGDGPLSFTCYEQLEAVYQSTRVRHFPNCDAMISRFSAPPNIVQQWNLYAESCVLPGYDYFRDRFTGTLGSTVAAFKAAHLLVPQKVVLLQPVASTVESLRLFPFLGNLIEEMKTELPAYLAAATDVESESDVDILFWWKQHASILPNWASAAQQIALIQPSSGAAERAFSVLNNSFASNQDNSLSDYVETSIMLQYNGR